jgi:hypothetical protein
MWAKLSREQREAIARIGLMSTQCYGHATGDVKCWAPDRTPAGRAAHSRTLRRLRDRGLIGRGRGRWVHLTEMGAELYGHDRAIDAWLAEQERRAAGRREAEAARRREADYERLRADVDAAVAAAERLRAAWAFLAAGWPGGGTPAVDPGVLAAAQTLGVGWPSSPAEVKAAYRRQAMRHHPDRGGCPERFKAARAAFERLIALL